MNKYKKQLIELQKRIEALENKQKESEDKQKVLEDKQNEFENKQKELEEKVEKKYLSDNTLRQEELIPADVLSEWMFGEQKGKK